MEKSVTLSASIDFWTHYRASRAVANRTWNNYLGWGFFFGIPLVLFAVMLYLRQDVSTPGLFGLPAWALPIIGFLFMTVLMPLVHALKIRSHRKRNRSAGSLQTYTITPEAYSLSGSLFDTTLKWDAFLKARETTQFFLSYVSSRRAHFIPEGGDLLRIRFAPDPVDHPRETWIKNAFVRRDLTKRCSQQLHCVMRSMSILASAHSSLGHSKPIRPEWSFGLAPSGIDRMLLLAWRHATFTLMPLATTVGIWLHILRRPKTWEIGSG